jgi:hypothetical protein
MMASKCRKNRNKKEKQKLLGKVRLPLRTRSGGAWESKKTYNRKQKHKGEYHDQDE